MFNRIFKFPGLLALACVLVLAFLVAAPVRAASTPTTSAITSIFYTSSGTTWTGTWYSYADAVNYGYSQVQSPSNCRSNSYNAFCTNAPTCTATLPSAPTCGLTASTGTGYTENIGALQFTVSTVSAPANPCSSLAGTTHTYGSAATGGTICAATFDGSGIPSATQQCEASSAAPTMVIHGSGATSVSAATITYTGNYCGAQLPANLPPSTASNVPDMNCVASGGVTSCLGSSGSCGTFNGDQVCPSSLAAGQCVSYASGGVACVATAPGGTTVTAPPAPSSSSAPNTPATPSATMTVGSGTSAVTVNYYSSSVVTNSSTSTVSASGGTNVGGSGSSSGGGYNGSSSAGSSGSGSSSSAPTDDCGVHDCTGSQSSAPAQDSVATTTTNYMTGVGNAPVVQAFSNVTSAFAGLGDGTCPTAQFDLWGHTYTIDVQCSLWANVADLVGIVMMVVWVFIGFRILASA